MSAVFKECKVDVEMSEIKEMKAELSMGGYCAASARGTASNLGGEGHMDVQG